MRLLKQQNLLNFYFYNTVKRIYLKTFKGVAVFEFQGLKTYRGDDGFLRFFFSNKRTLKSFLNFFESFMKGVSFGFFFELSIRGIGYKCYFFGSGKLFLNLGYSHYIIYELPKDVVVFLKKNRIYLYSLSKIVLGDVVKDLQNMRVADAYKAKGIVESGKVFSLKEGKKR